MVRGGIYEVDLNEWKCNSVYWPGPGLEIMRGTWFHDTSWQPVDCEHADRIEAEHIKRFMGHKMADYIWDPTNQCRREVMVSLEEQECLVGVALNMLSLLLQVQHSIQLEAVNKIKVDSRWGFETHGFSDKASTTRREWGRFPGSSCARMLICLLLIGLLVPLSLLKPRKTGFFLVQSFPFKEGLLRIQLHILWCELDRTSSNWGSPTACHQIALSYCPVQIRLHCLPLLCA